MTQKQSNSISSGTKNAEGSVKKDPISKKMFLVRTPSELKLDSIEVFFIEVTYAREFSFGVWPTRLHSILRLRAGEHSGWSELCLPLYGKTCEEIANYVAKDFSRWKGLTVREAFDQTVSLRGKVPDRILESMEMSLIDLDARIQGMSAIRYLNLSSGITAVPGLGCILQKEIGKAVEIGKTMAKTHLKMKLFGEVEHDSRLVSEMRKVIPADCFMVGDVNYGYGPGKEPLPLTNAMVESMRRLYASGLDACEDPANLSWNHIALLKKLVPDLVIIPDAPMRPSYKIIEFLHPVPGNIYNLHPGCMGSVSATVALAEKLLNGKAGVMIGDSSLIGPSCTAWQQIACGLGASWCEALEKPEESTKFLDCITASATRIRKNDHFCEIVEERNGFGLEVDTDKLHANSLFFMEYK